MMVRFRTCSRPDASWTRFANEIPIGHSTWCTEHCRRRRPSALDCDRRCSRSWASPCRTRTGASVRYSRGRRHRNRPVRCRQTGVTVAVVPGGPRTAGKHHQASRARTVQVGLARKGDLIVLTIDDDGTGFDPAIVDRYVADGISGWARAGTLRRDGRCDEHRLADRSRHPGDSDIATPVSRRGDVSAPLCRRFGDLCVCSC